MSNIIGHIDFSDDAIFGRSPRIVLTDDSPYKAEPITDPEWIIGILASWIHRTLVPRIEHPSVGLEAQRQIAKARKRARRIRRGIDQPRASLVIYASYIERAFGKAVADTLRDELVIHL